MVNRQYEERSDSSMEKKFSLLQRLENKVPKKLYKIMGIAVCCLDLILAFYLVSGIVYYQAIQSNLHTSQDNSFKWQLLLILLFEVFLAPFTFWFAYGGLVFHKRAHCIMLIIFKLLQGGMMLFSGIIEIITNDCAIDSAIRPFLNCRNDVNILLLVIRLFYDTIVLFVSFLALTYAVQYKKVRDRRNMQSTLNHASRQNPYLNRSQSPGRVEKTKLTNAFTASNGFVKLRSELQGLHSRNQHRMQEVVPENDGILGTTAKYETMKSEELKMPNAYFRRDKQGNKKMKAMSDVSNLRLMKSSAKKGAFRKLIKFGSVMS